MAGSVNKVIIVGNLGADPEVKSFQNGGRVANLRIATSESWKDRASGEVQVWQSGEVRGGQVRFSAHGWSDFCPLREVSLCQMP